MRGERILIVNADDFGHSPEINAGVSEAHETGIVTSASLMVTRPWARAAAASASSTSSLDLGLHLDLCEWTYSNESWTLVYERVPTSDAEAVERQARAQLDRFRQLVGRDPTHLDSHQHVHLEGPVAAVAIELARELAVPLRERSSVIRYCGAFYGQTAKGEPFHEAITAERLVDLIETLPSGITEVCCHPGRGPISDRYGPERERELEVLCDSKPRAAIEREGIVLASFAELRSLAH
jgi:chitin disaccharide deacetylase